MNDIVIREAEAGEPSLVVHFYYKLFEKQFGFLPGTEQYFLHAVAELFDEPENSRLWVAVDDGVIKGSVCIIRKSSDEAQLRLFGTDPSLQGLGIGTQLMEKAMGFCKEKGYGHIYLWTIDICKSALHVYDKFGFKRTDTKPNDTWADYPMTEELWEYVE